ncbi:uncharacterized protein [Spinacia oleracea]|uniref:SWIM-type domain-containing protein n=1 Tax=Spinacia oleracea TaxID=3562 RepID=A0ABM3RHQ2_SPIOL|nr:uncharacterized protein LOC130469724 [Spinacia oleracea]
MAKELIHGGFSESYGLLPAYAEMIKRTNPGSYALVTWTKEIVGATPHFKSCFFSFACMIKGFFEGCRPIIGIDGAHLSGTYKGQMLTAIAIDGNNEIFPIAYGIVDGETGDTWAYFFRCLRQMFRNFGVHREDWTFISDRMRGVDGAVYEVFPQATRRVCAQHLYSNCKQAGWHGTAFHKSFWVAANAYNPYVYNKAMEKIAKIDPKAVDYLSQVPEQWSRHKFEPHVVCDHNTTNFVESFNACTKPFRDMPVYTLMEEARSWCMKKIGSRFDKAVEMGPNQLTEYAAGLLGEGNIYEVKEGDVKYPIKFDARTCGCGVWQISGIPCRHGLRVIYHQRLEATDFVSHYFKGQAYKLTYSEHIHPMPDPTQWPSFDLPIILPPPMKRASGRPPKLRKRGKHDPKRGKRNSTVRCAAAAGSQQGRDQGASSSQQQRNASSKGKRKRT